MSKIRVSCAFRKPVDFKNGYIVDAFLDKKKVDVSINDISKDWSLPCGMFDDKDVFIWVTKDLGNPKVRRMSRDEFDRVFEITNLTTQRGRYPFERGKTNRMYYIRFWIDNKILLNGLKFLRLLKLL